MALKKALQRIKGYRGTLLSIPVCVPRIPRFRAGMAQAGHALFHGSHAPFYEGPL